MTRAPWALPLLLVLLLGSGEADQPAIGDVPPPDPNAGLYFEVLPPAEHEVVFLFTLTDGSSIELFWDGRVEYIGEPSLDEAAIMFWEYLAEHAPCKTELTP